MGNSEKKSAKTNFDAIYRKHSARAEAGGGASLGNAPKTATARRTAVEEKSSPQLGRILLWGAVLGFVACTVMYFLTYETKDVVPSTAERGILFHKIAPSAIPAVFKVPAYSAPSVGRTPQAQAAVEPPLAVKIAKYVERTYPYVVHIASYRNLDVAKEKAAEYSRGFKAFLVHVDLKAKGIWYRLHIGHFPDATAAMDAIHKYFTKEAVVGHTRYACLIGSFSSAEASDAASLPLSAKGFLPYTIAIDSAYHVFVGAHPTRAAAENLSQTLSMNGFTNDLIQR